MPVGGIERPPVGDGPPVETDGWWRRTPVDTHGWVETDGRWRQTAVETDGRAESDGWAETDAGGDRRLVEMGGRVDVRVLITRGRSMRRPVTLDIASRGPA